MVEYFVRNVVTIRKNPEHWPPQLHWVGQSDQLFKTHKTKTTLGKPGWMGSLL